jgi:3-deoxy-D-manno-octulosonic-acid transferase
MKWLYRIIFVPALLIASPYYLWRMIKRGGYRKDFSQRLGFFPLLPPKDSSRRRLWIQAVSVGEIQAIGPLLRGLKNSGKTEVVLTTTTSTGYHLARELYAELCLKIGLFPIDFWPCSHIAWGRIQPDAVVLTEGELWPEHLGHAERRHVPALLINARLSDKSFQRHQKFNWFTKSLVQKFSWIGAGSEADANRFEKVGASANRIEVTGNLKFDVPSTDPLSHAEKNKLRESLGFGQASSTVVILGSSTWEGEETLLLETVKQLRNSGVDTRLLLVPRHAERREALMKEIRLSGLSYHQRSVGGTTAPANTIVHLADTTGELRTLTPATDLAFCGKSLPPHEGGQTPIDCAASGVPLVYGPGMSNFREICRGLESIGSATEALDVTSAKEALMALAKDEKKRLQQSQTAVIWHEKNRGATERTLQKLLS